MQVKDSNGNLYLPRGDSLGNLFVSLASQLYGEDSTLGRLLTSEAVKISSTAITTNTSTLIQSGKSVFLGAWVSNAGTSWTIQVRDNATSAAGGTNKGTAVTAGNHCVTNNYVKLRDDANNTAAALYHGNLQRGIVINNILDGGANTACYDYFYVNGAVTITKTNNVYVRNRIGGTPPADTVAIASPGTLAWTQGQGLPSGHAYYTSGKGDVDLVSKMARGRMGLRGRPLDRAIGPFSAETSRVAR